MKQDGLLNSGIPLGGLGAGSVELRRDGYFHEWQIMNNRPLGTGPAVDVPPDAAFFGIHCKNLEPDWLGAGAIVNRTALLGLPAAYQTGKFSLLGHFLNDPYHMPWLEHASSIEASTFFPLTTLDYDLGRPGFPIQVSLDAFSPFIPLDAKNSALPLAFLTFKLRNLTAEDFQVSLLGGLRNLVGYSYSEQPSRMAFERADSEREPALSWIHMSREHVPADASDNGTLALGVLGEGETSYVFHPRTSRDVWDPFHRSGRLENVDIGDFSGSVGNEGAAGLARLRQGLPLGALCHSIHLPAGQERRVVFILAWHFPNFIEADYPAKKRMGQPIGHRYADWFNNAVEVLEYAARNLESLRERSRAFAGAYYSSSYPDWLLQAAAAQLTTLVKSSWWDRQGRFGIWEGLGCCGLQTTDITYYGSFPILQFFPEIQQSQMRLTRDNAETPGKIPHMMPANFACSDVDHRGRIDLIPQYILLVWRDVLWSGDLDYAREMWPSLKEALAYFSQMDSDGDGLPNNTGPDQTYDQFPLKGTSAFVGFLYAASLRAAAELGELLGDTDYAAEQRRRLKDALKKLDEQLWTGEYYRLCYDLATETANDGVMADQVNGDWFVRQTTGAGLLPDRKVRAAVDAVVEHCTAPQGYVANCAWPFGGAIEIGRHTSDQANSPWSGVEYALAAHLILLGREREGLEMAWNVWDRYERAGLRFNHIECGANYYRALSSWAVYLALTGFAWNALDGALTLSARRKDGQFVFNTPAAWGVVQTGGAQGAVEITVREGALELKELRLKGHRAGSVRVTLGGVPVSAEPSQDGSYALLSFARPLRLEAGSTLTVQPVGEKSATIAS